MNTETGEAVGYNLRLHIRYFVTTQEKPFSIVVIICIVMANILLGFLGYHLCLAYRNHTTNETYKRDHFVYVINREKRIIDLIVKKTEDWKPDPDNLN